MRFVTLFLTAIYTVSICSISIDIYRNPNKFEDNFGFSSLTLILIFLFGYSFIKFTKLAELNLTVIKINNLLVFPISTVLFVVLSIVELLHGPNYVYGSYLINLISFGYISILSVVVLLLNSKEVFSKITIKGKVFLLYFVIFAYALLINFLPLDLFKVLSSEDNFIENAQFFVLLFSSLISLFLFLKSKSTGAKVVYILICAVLLFVAGDEISWGQRVFGIITPEIIAQSNIQEEITFHNTGFFHGVVGYIYAAIGFYGAFAWVFIKRENKLVQSLVPPWFTMPYFLTAFFYNSITIFVVHDLAYWSELTEFMLYLGVCLYLLLSYKVAARKN